MVVDAFHEKEDVCEQARQDITNLSINAIIQSEMQDEIFPLTL